MMRRDTRNPEVVYQLRNERQDHHGHDEGQSDEFQQTPAELRQHVGDQIQKSFMKRPEMRMSVFHQNFLVYKLEKFNWPPERPDNGKYKDSGRFCIQRMTESMLL